MTFAEKFLNLRKSENMSQEEIADKLNVSRQAVSRWEMGTAMPDAQNLLQISRLYGVSIDYLLNDELTENINTVADMVSETKKKKILKPIYFIIAYIIGLLVFPTVYTAIFGFGEEFEIVNIFAMLADKGMNSMAALGIIMFYSRLYLWVVILFAVIYHLYKKSCK